MTATNEPAPVAAASAGDRAASDLVPPAGSEASIALRDLDERCARAELNLRQLLDVAAVTYMDHDRLSGKVAGVSLVRSYIAEALRGAS